jgi:cobalamin synthase
MIDDKKIRVSIADRMIRSNFARAVTVLTVVVMSISLLRKITRTFQGELLLNDIIDEVAILIMLGYAFLTQSKNEKVISFIQKTPLIILAWVCVFSFTFFLIDPPINYWVASFFTLMIISYYLLPWYRKRRNQRESSG